MRIENHTRWSTEDLRYMIGQAFRDHGIKSRRVKVSVRRGKFIRGRADRGQFRANIQRTTGAQLTRQGPAKLVCGQWLDLWLPNPQAVFDPTGEMHTEFVVMLAREFDALAVIMASGQPSAQWQEKPITWLSDWFEVHRGRLGLAAGARISPLMPAIEPLEKKDVRRSKKLEHAKSMLKKAKNERRH